MSQRRDVSIPSHGEQLGAWHYPATSATWTTDAGRPCVVMAHGFACTRDSGLAPYAEAYAAAGADVLVFDYRGFADSTGTPRQMVDHRRHREDYHAALAYARALSGVDPERLVVWGSSYSGGHVLPVAAQDGRLAGVMSQGAAMDGLAAVLLIREYAGLRGLARVSLAGTRGLLGRVARRRITMPVFGPPGTVAAMTSADSESGYSSIAGPSFRNELDAAGVPLIPLNRPVRFAARVQAPMLLVIAEDDSVAPVASVEEVAARATRAGTRVVVHRETAGHFDIYRGEPFQRCLAAQLAFLAEVVGEQSG
ncbi:alpha/beta hydrolase [Nocardioides acrostichi]|uniref:Alpha/beta hydrolase n=1 Tax=Nocardioides acrostichi TaxID=2784339 RepID=A0A930V2I0_9ACTN|nr:alpha/beta hydrolase [Nocardioides acrostichi]MBF4161989.1 alpha/beta hydrolase [Nocardioides acrostichi]